MVVDVANPDEIAEVRAHLVLSSHALLDDGDDETTEWTDDAKEEARRILSGHRAASAQFVELGGETVLVEVIGQAPDQRRFRQGVRPERLRFLLRMEKRGISVLLAFYHGIWEVAWLSTLPDPENIMLKRDGDRDAARVGWYAGEDEETGVFWVSETFDLEHLPPKSLPRPADEFVGVRMFDGLG
jgi:hypothetical protein